ncbi:MAG: hypothetical protein ACREF1_00660, partial [Acetobacteraceae bacterium]
RKRQIRRRLRPAFKAGCVGRDAQRLLRDLEERIDDDAEDPGQRPLAEAVARICRDLGISPDRIPALAGPAPAGEGAFLWPMDRVLEIVLGTLAALLVSLVRWPK